MTKKQLETEIFNTVYQWGRNGVIVTADSPYFKKLLAEYLKKSKTK